MSASPADLRTVPACVLARGERNWKIPSSARGRRAGTNMRRPAHRGPPTLRPRSGQPCALCRLGGLRACATARRTRVRLRVASRAIRRQSAAVCSAAAPTEAARGHSGRVRRHGLRLSSGASSRNRAASASSRRGAARRIPRYVVGGIPPPRLACAPRPPRRTVRLSRASAGLRALEAASPAAKEFFFVFLSRPISGLYPRASSHAESGIVKFLSRPRDAGGYESWRFAG